MRKPDDDLKIDIAELFGGDIAPARQAAEEMAPAPADPAGTPVAEAAPPPDTQYQAWISAREMELEAKTQALEKQLQDLLEQKLQAAQSAAIPAAPEPEAPPAPAPPEPAPEAGPIDFNAPMAPPFMGQAPAAPSSAEAAAPAHEIAPSNEEELRRIQKEYEYLMLYDEYRNIIIHELKDLVGEKKTYKMLERTFELAREKFPDVFRNANWNAAGNLLEDGSMESQRLIENKDSLEPSKAAQVFDAALGALLSLRLQAVEKGLGTGMKNKVRARLYQWISEKTEKASHSHKDAADLERLKAYVV